MRRYDLVGVGMIAAAVVAFRWLSPAPPTIVVQPPAVTVQAASPAPAPDFSRIEDQLRQLRDEVERLEAPTVVYEGDGLTAADIADAVIDHGLAAGTTLDSLDVNITSIAADAIGAAELATDAIVAAEIAANAISAAEIWTDDIASDSIGELPRGGFRTGDQF